MDHSNVVPIIDSLIEEFDRVIEELNQEGARRFFTSDYSQAKEILIDVEEVASLKERVSKLREEWKKLDLSISTTKDIEKKNVDSRKFPKSKIPKGLRTREEDLEVPLLLALDSLGGTGDIHDVMNIIESLLAKDLSDFDWQTLPSDPNSIRWKNTVHWARAALVEKGLLSKTSPRGIWEITEAGRVALNESKKKQE